MHQCKSPLGHRRGSSREIEWFDYEREMLSSGALVSRPDRSDTRTYESDVDRESIERSKFETAEKRVIESPAYGPNERCQGHAFTQSA